MAPVRLGSCTFNTQQHKTAYGPRGVVFDPWIKPFLQAILLEKCYREIYGLGGKSGTGVQRVRTRKFQEGFTALVIHGPPTNCFLEKRAPLAFALHVENPAAPSPPAAQF